MARETTASFICEVPLKATPADERELLIRLDCARMVYNACLGESLRRLRQLHESRAFKDAKKLPKGVRGSEAYQKRKEAFRDADEQAGFREYDLHVRRVTTYQIPVANRMSTENVPEKKGGKCRSRDMLMGQGLT